MFKKVIEFWFQEVDPSKWWEKDESFDEHIRQRFSVLHAQAVRCELYAWRCHSLGRLAEIILLDQFSRNMYRGSPQAYANDSMALSLAQESIAVGADNELTAMQNTFLFMPFMHSESNVIHNIAETLYEQNGVVDSLKFERQHKKIIERFGRYPHRNEILGRASTDEEVEFLKQPGSSF